MFKYKIVHTKIKTASTQKPTLKPLVQDIVPRTAIKAIPQHKKTNKRLWLIFAIGLVVVALAGTGFYLYKSRPWSATKSYDNFVNLDSTYDRNKLDKAVYGVPDFLFERGLNVVFISDAYYDKAEFEAEVAFAKNALRTAEPWRSYQNFNFFSIYPNESFCDVETENHPVPLLRCNSGINDYILPLGLIRFKAVIISKQTFTSWSNVTRLNNSLIAFSRAEATKSDSLDTKILLHEMGHGFGLKDEMAKGVIAQADSIVTTPDGPNCVPDVETAMSLWDDKIKRVDNAYVFGEEGDIGFYEGCAGNVQYIKPTKHSVMNLQELSADNDNYGPVSEEYLGKVLKYCFSPTVYNYKDDPDFFDFYPEYKECIHQ